MKWVQYPFMMAMALENNCNGNGKMGIMESSDGVHTAAVTATENLISLVAVAVTQSVNEP